jgi:putative transposase
MDMRKPRSLLDGARYHVTARANRREMILHSNEVKMLFMSVLERARARYVFSIDNFCVMENHFHLIIKPGKGESLSRIMQWIMSVFAMALNKRNGWKGHVWGERFFSKIISSFRSFIEVFDYIDSNPVKAGIAREPQEWQYGGLAWHRRGLFGLIDRMPALLLCLFPSHAQLSIPAPGGG